MDTSTFNTHMSDPKKNGLSFKNFGVLFKKICQIFNGKSPLRHKTSIYVLTELCFNEIKDVIFLHTKL